MEVSNQEYNTIREAMNKHPELKDKHIATILRKDNGNLVVRLEESVESLSIYGKRGYINPRTNEFDFW